MSEAADEILQAGIRDAKTALIAIQSFDEGWKVFARACQTQQLDVANVYGERLVALVESAVDLYLSSHRRIAQFEKLTKDPES